MNPTKIPLKAMLAPAHPPEEEIMSNNPLKIQIKMKFLLIFLYGIKR